MKSATLRLESQKEKYSSLIQGYVLYFKMYNAKTSRVIHSLQNFHSDVLSFQGEIVVNSRCFDTQSYTSLHSLVNGMFPPTNSSEQVQL